MYKYTAAKLKHRIYFVQKLIIVENKDKKQNKKFPHNDNSNGQRILGFYIHKTKTYILHTCFFSLDEGGGKEEYSDQYHIK